MSSTLGVRAGLDAVGRIDALTDAHDVHAVIRMVFSTRLECGIQHITRVECDVHALTDAHEKHARRDTHGLHHWYTRLPRVGCGTPCHRACGSGRMCTVS